MKKNFLMSGMVFLLLILSACGEAPKGQEIEPEAISKYQTKIKNAVDISNNLLATYNKGLDQLYTNSISNEQFGDLMNSNIETSNEMVRGIDEYTPDPMFFEIHQSVITHLNNQHQMFLDAVEMANQEDIAKEQLREKYLEIKTEQKQLINSIRTL